MACVLVELPCRLCWYTCVRTWQVGPDSPSSSRSSSSSSGSDDAEPCAGGDGDSDAMSEVPDLPDLAFAEALENELMPHS